MTVLSGRPVAFHVPRVVALCTTAVLLAFIIQTAVLPALGLSAAVPLVFTVVAVLGLALGSQVAALTGFAAGLLLDLTGSGVLGVGALVGCLLGVAAGRIPVDRWRWSGFAQVWAGTSLAAVCYSLGNALLEGRGMVWSTGWLWVLGGAAGCALMLVPQRDRVRAVVR